MAASIPHHHYMSFDYAMMSSRDEEACNIFNNMSNGAIDMLPLLNSPASFPEPPFVMNSDCMLLPQMSEIDTAFRDFSVSDYNQNHVFEAREDQCATGLMLPNFYSPMPPQNYQAIQGGKAAAQVEESDQVKVGRYSVEERKDRILRYLKKRNHRNFNKTIKYACRKTLADKRVRVRGRFAKNNEPSQEEEDVFINTTPPHFYQHNNSLFHDDDDDSFQQMIKYDEDYWLQAAMDNIGNLPYLGS